MRCGSPRGERRRVIAGGARCRPGPRRKPPDAGYFAPGMLATLVQHRFELRNSAALWTAPCRASGCWRSPARCWLMMASRVFRPPRPRGPGARAARRPVASPGPEWVRPMRRRSLHQRADLAALAFAAEERITAEARGPSGALRWPRPAPPRCAGPERAPLRGKWAAALRAPAHRAALARDVGPGDHAAARRHPAASGAMALATISLSAFAASPCRVRNSCRQGPKAAGQRTIQRGAARTGQARHGGIGMQADPRVGESPVSPAPPRQGGRHSRLARPRMVETVAAPGRAKRSWRRPRQATVSACVPRQALDSSAGCWSAGTLSVHAARRMCSGTVQAANQSSSRQGSRGVRKFTARQALGKVHSSSRAAGGTRAERSSHSTSGSQGEQLPARHHRRVRGASADVSRPRGPGGRPVSASTWPISASPAQRTSRRPVRLWPRRRLGVMALQEGLGRGPHHPDAVAAHHLGRAWRWRPPPRGRPRCVEVPEQLGHAAGQQRVEAAVGSRCSAASACCWSPPRRIRSPHRQGRRAGPPRRTKGERDGKGGGGFCRSRWCGDCQRMLPPDSWAQTHRCARRGGGCWSRELFAWACRCVTSRVCARLLCVTSERRVLISRSARPELRVLVPGQLRLLAHRGPFHAGMRVHDGRAQRIGCIPPGSPCRLSRRCTMAWICSSGVAVADDGLLHLQRRVLGDRQVAGHQPCQRSASRSLAQQQGGLWVDVDEDDLRRRIVAGSAPPLAGCRHTGSLMRAGSSPAATLLSPDGARWPRRRGAGRRRR